MLSLSNKVKMCTEITEVTFSIENRYIIIRDRIGINRLCLRAIQLLMLSFGHENPACLSITFIVVYTSLYFYDSLSISKRKFHGFLNLPLSKRVERNNPYYFFPANQQKAGTKIYSLTQCSLSVNECDWHILAGKDERINAHCLTRLSTKMITIQISELLLAL